MRKTYLLFALLVLLFCMPLQAEAANPKNKMVTKADGFTYYYNNNRRAVSDRFVTIKNKTYYFDIDKHLVKYTLFDVDGKTYYADRQGVIAKNKIVTFYGIKYFFGSNGAQRTGWVTYNGNRYYFLKHGGCVTNAWRKSGGSYYHFDSKGRMQRNTWVDSYYINPNGRRADIVAPAPAKARTSKTISMKPLLQNPELPTGCESVALTIVLKYLGFNLSKTTIASNYLPLSSSSNFVTAFAGSPFSYNGAGIYAPGLKIAANNFMKAKGSSKHAFNLTGISFSNLYRFIDNNMPVIVWNSMYMRTPIPSFSMRTLGKSWTFYTYEHCVVLCGYNKKNGTVLINDPLDGLVWRNAKSFEKIYNTLGKMAIVIQ